MKFTGRNAAWAAMLVSLTAVSAFAQDKPVWVRAVYVKTKPGQAAAYDAFRDSTIRKGSEGVVKSGAVSASISLRLVYPIAAQVGHDRVAISVYPGAPPEPQSILDTFHKNSGMSREEYLAKRSALDNVVAVHLIREDIVLGGTTKAGDYIRVSYLKIKPGSQAEYSDLGKMNKASLEKAMHGGQLPFGGYRRGTIFGAGSDSEFQALQAFFYSSWDDVFKSGGPSPRDAFLAAFPGQNYESSYLDRLRAISETKHQAIYRVDNVITK